MAIEMGRPTFFPRRINMFVEALTFADAVNQDGPTRVSFDKPAASAVNNIMNGNTLSVLNATTVFDLSGQAAAQGIIEPWGRTITARIQSAGSIPANTSVLLRGADYLGQPMSERLIMTGTVAAAGTFTVNSKKAFKYLDQFLVTSVGTIVTTAFCGWGPSLGLPYRTIRAQYEITNGQAVATLGSLVAANPAMPQTETSADPRGIYTPIGVMNSSNVISLVVDCVNDLNSSYQGGLHGIRHVFT